MEDTPEACTGVSAVFTEEDLLETEEASQVDLPETEVALAVRDPSGMTVVELTLTKTTRIVVCPLKLLRAKTVVASVAVATSG